jgi:hypothetical protein
MSYHTSQLAYVQPREHAPHQPALEARSDRSPDPSLDILCSSNYAHAFVCPVQLQGAISSDCLGLTTGAQTPEIQSHLLMLLPSRVT